MRTRVFWISLGLTAMGFLPLWAKSQDGPSSKPVIVHVQRYSALAAAASSIQPVKDPATPEQIRQYLALSGDMESFRASWMAALEKNRPKGAPYWPEAFWVSEREEMQKADLMPMFVIYYQHGVSKELMQSVIDAYHTLGTEHFRGSPACFRLGDALLPMNEDMEKLKLAETQDVLMDVYEAYKPAIKAARARYIAEHPGWTDK